MPALFLTAKLQFLSEKWDCGTDRYFETMFLIKPSPAASARDALRNLLPLGCLPLTSYPIGAAHSLHLFFSVCDWLAPGGRGSWGAGLTEGGAPPSYICLFIHIGVDTWTLDGVHTAPLHTNSCWFFYVWNYSNKCERGPHVHSTC